MLPSMAAPDEVPAHTPTRGPWPVVAAIAALLAMAPVGFFYALSGLVATPPGLYGMWLFYAALLGLTVRLARRRSYWVLIVPLVGAVSWFALIQAGSAWWGWQA